MKTVTDFERDEAKAASNFAKHGVRFESATLLILSGSYLEFDATNVVDGEVRRKAIGLIDNDLYAVIFTYRLAKIRLISARRANRKEETLYGNGSISV